MSLFSYLSTLSTCTQRVFIVVFLVLWRCLSRLLSVTCVTVVFQVSLRCVHSASVAGSFSLEFLRQEVSLAELCETVSKCVTCVGENRIVP